MNTSYIRFCQQRTDPVWGSEALTWIRTPLVRVTRNRLRQAQFEWVGNPALKLDVEAIRKAYPLVLHVTEVRNGKD